MALFFLLAYGVSWILWAPLWLPAFDVHGLPVLPYHHALGALGPITAAFLVSAKESGRAGPADLLQRMGLWRGRLLWVAIGLATPLVLLAIAVGVASIFGGEAGKIPDGAASSREFPQFPALGFLAYNIISFGYGEEVGWRGFALPRLQTRHSALVASLLLTVGWAIWHVPLFLYRPGYTGMGAAGIAGWFFSLLTGSVLLTWLYNSSRGSLLVVALFHATVDVAFTSGFSSPFAVNAAGAVITLWGCIVLIGMRSLPPLPFRRSLASPPRTHSIFRTWGAIDR
ncbi:MAG: CPBP family intramembrane glutamic endopeptidase [Fibrobacteria bacterium]